MVATLYGAVEPVANMLVGMSSTSPCCLPACLVDVRKLSFWFSDQLLLFCHQSENIVNYDPIFLMFRFYPLRIYVKQINTVGPEILMKNYAFIETLSAIAVVSECLEFNAELVCPFSRAT